MDASTTFEVPTALQRLLLTAPEEPTEICTICLVEVSVDREFEIEENQNHAKILSLLKELQEIEIAASQRGL